MSEAYAWFGAAYFFYDIWSMYKVYVYTAVKGTMNGKASKENQKGRIRKVFEYLIGQPLIILHHLFIGSFGFLLIVVRKLNIKSQKNEAIPFNDLNYKLRCALSCSWKELFLHSLTI